MTLLLLALACRPEAPSSKDTADTDTGDTADTGDAVDPRFDALVAAILADLEANNASGASVAILEGGEVTFAAGLGSADPDGDVPVTTTQLFQIGSTTKMMAAALLLRDVDAGRVSLDDTFGARLPDLSWANDPRGADATMHQLISHQGGYYDWIDWAGASEDAALADGAVWFGRNAFNQSPPGAFWNYSNPNFSFAGLVSEDVNAQPWADLLEVALLEPLGMTRSTARKSAVEADGDYALSYGYDLDDLDGGRTAFGRVAMDQVPEPGFARPAGLVWSTPTEMLAFARFLLEGDTAVLADASRRALTTPQVSTGYGAEQAYGYGVFVDEGFYAGDDWYPIRVWSHGGNTLSFTSTFYILPDQGFAISILSNGYGDDFSASVATAFTSLAELPSPTDGPEYAVDPEGLDAHVGRYVDEWNVGEMIVTREGDGLSVSMPALDELGYAYEPELVPLSTDVWYLVLEGAYYDLTFIDGADGAPSTYIRNRLFVATRSEEARARPLVPKRGPDAVIQRRPTL